MRDVVLETKNLSYMYPDGTRALQGVSMQIRRGLTTAIIGGNGAGKSTLLLNVNGILKPSEGQVLYEGKPVDYSRKGLRELRKSVGLVFQDPENQLFSASVYQDVSFGPMNLKLTEEEVRRRVTQGLERTGMLHLKDKPTHSLSFGQKKRIAIAGVFAMEPVVFLLDEPTAGLDPQGVGEIMKFVKETQQNTGLSVVISTHDIALALKEQPYIKMAAHYGARPAYLIFRHFFPEISPLIMVSMIRLAGMAIVTEASLSFLGLGDPTSRSWGLIINHAVNFRGIYVTPFWKWWLLYPWIFLTLLVSSLALLGRDLERMADPRLMK